MSTPNAHAFRGSTTAIAAGIRLMHAGQPSDAEVAIAPAHSGLPYRVRKFLHADQSTGEAATVEQTVALAVTSSQQISGRPPSGRPIRTGDASATTVPRAHTAHRFSRHDSRHQEGVTHTGDARTLL